MSDGEITANIIIAMINNNFLATSEQVVEAYKTIYISVSQIRN